jgi:ATP-dependent Clp protease ATP-binding subunit ClpA
MAEDEANALRHAEVGTEHLLLGLLREGRGLATRALRELGVDPAELGKRVRGRLVPADVGAVGRVDLGPGARSALEMARAEASRLHHDYIGTEHLLLGLLRDGEGPAFVALVGVGVTLGRARQQIVKLMNESSPELPGGRTAGLALLRGRGAGPDRFGERIDHDHRADEPERCGRCGRVRRSEWRYCAYCGEHWPCCDRCDTPLPRLPGVRFCSGCGVMVEAQERE